MIFTDTFNDESLFMAKVMPLSFATGKAATPWLPSG